jgi:hypothetical protein
MRADDDYRAKAVCLLEQADRQNDQAMKVVYVGLAGAFAMLAKRAKMKADLKGSAGAGSQSSRAATDRARPITVNLNCGGREAGSLVDDAAVDAGQRPASPWQVTPAKPFNLTIAQCQVMLDAYAEAVATRKSVADCYKAGVNALYQLYPDVPREVIAAEAVTILTTARGCQMSQRGGALPTLIEQGRRIPELPTKTANGRGRSRPISSN